MVGEGHPVIIVAYKRLINLERIVEFCFVHGHRIYIYVDHDAKESAENVAVKDFAISAQHKYGARSFLSPVSLGVGHAIPNAIDWLLSREQYGIVLEDDCIPICDFNAYVTWSLKEMRNGRASMSSLMSVSSLLSQPIPHGSFTSSYPLTWGWVVEKDFWHKMQYARKRYIRTISQSVLRGKVVSLGFFGAISIRYNLGDGDGWDGNLAFQMLCTNQICLIPGKSYISNEGADIFASHITKKDNFIIDKLNSATSKPEVLWLNPANRKRIDKVIESLIYGMKYRHMFSPLKTLIYLAQKKFSVER